MSAMLVLTDRACGSVAEGGLYASGIPRIEGRLLAYTAIAAPFDAEVANPRRAQAVAMGPTLDQAWGLVSPTGDDEPYKSLPAIGMGDLWGKCYYRNVWDAVHETARFGACRRISHVPDEVKVPYPVLMLHQDAFALFGESTDFVESWLCENFPQEPTMRLWAVEPRYSLDNPEAKVNQEIINGTWPHLAGEWQGDKWVLSGKGPEAETEISHLESLGFFDVNEFTPPNTAPPWLSACGPEGFEGHYNLFDWAWQDADRLGRVGCDDYLWHSHVDLWRLVPKLKEARLLSRFMRECDITFDMGVFGLTWITNIVQVLRPGQDDVDPELKEKGVEAALSEHDPRAAEQEIPQGTEM